MHTPTPALVLGQQSALTTQFNWPDSRQMFCPGIFAGIAAYAAAGSATKRARIERRIIVGMVVSNGECAMLFRHVVCWSFLILQSRYAPSSERTAGNTRPCLSTVQRLLVAQTRYSVHIYNHCAISGCYHGCYKLYTINFF